MMEFISRYPCKWKYIHIYVSVYLNKITHIFLHEKENLLYYNHTY